MALTDLLLSLVRCARAALLPCELCARSKYVLLVFFGAFPLRYGNFFQYVSPSAPVPVPSPMLNFEL